MSNVATHSCKELAKSMSPLRQYTTRVDIRFSGGLKSWVMDAMKGNAKPVCVTIPIQVCPFCGVKLFKEILE